MGAAVGSMVKGVAGMMGATPNRSGVNAWTGRPVGWTKNPATGTWGPGNWTTGTWAPPPSDWNSGYVEGPTGPPRGGSGGSFNPYGNTAFNGLMNRLPASGFRSPAAADFLAQVLGQKVPSSGTSGGSSGPGAGGGGFNAPSNIDGFLALLQRLAGQVGGGKLPGVLPPAGPQKEPMYHTLPYFGGGVMDIPAMTGGQNPGGIFGTVNPIGDVQPSTGPIPGLDMMQGMLYNGNSFPVGMSKPGPDPAPMTALKQIGPGNGGGAFQPLAMNLGFF